MMQRTVWLMTLLVLATLLTNTCAQTGVLDRSETGANTAIESTANTENNNNRGIDGVLRVSPVAIRRQLKSKSASDASSKAPKASIKSTKAPSLKSTKAPSLKSTKAPSLKSTKAPSLKSTKAPSLKSTKAPKSTKVPKSTKAPKSRR